MHTMELPLGLSIIPITEWENGHKNFKVKVKKNASFNMRLPFSFNEHEKNYHATTENFKWLIRHAIEKNITLRALGNAWSFSEVAACDGGFVDTRELRTFFPLGKSFLSPAYLAKGKTEDDLLFTQCGMSILQLNKELEEENGYMRCLRASGASNGQTIAGATSTGTHGSAMSAGAVHDAIVGLHIITGPDRHVWLERASNPVASDKFIEWLKAEPIRNDDMFNAAVVSFGSFGFIHGVLLETEPIYLLEKHTTGMLPYNDAIRAAINNLDFTALEPKLPRPVNGPDHSLYHFEVVVNPHKFAVNDASKGVYVKVIYKIPHAVHPVPSAGTAKFQYGDELLGVIQTVLDGLGKKLVQKLVPPLVNKLFPLAYAADEKAIGTIGEIFTNTRFRGKAASAAIGIDAVHTSQVVEEIVQINGKAVFPGAIALRYVNGTKALLGFTKFKSTCVLELDGVDSATSRNFYQKIWDRLEELQIPYTLHWGKINFNLDGPRVRRMYGDTNVNKWLTCRHTLLDEATRKVFTNQFMKQCGLHQAPF
jgi:FAD binding domain